MNVDVNFILARNEQLEDIRTMGNDISTIGGAVATAATAVAAAATLGLVDEVNEAVVDCAKFTAKNAENSLVRHAGETVVMGIATAGVAAAVVLTAGQVDAVNQATIGIASQCGAAAEKTGKGVVQVVDQVSDGIPVVGHVKGGILYACGDNEGGARALQSASRTVGVIGGGVGGFVVGGPVGAVACGVAAGAAMDGITTGIDNAVHGEYRSHGQVACWTHVVTASNADDRIAGIVGGVLTPVMDGFAGYSAGKAVAKIKTKSGPRSLGQYNKRELELSPKELLKLRRRIAKREAQGIRTTAAPSQPRDTSQDTYRGNSVPQQSYTQPSETVYRGDQRLFAQNGLETAFEEGIPSRGTATDVFDHVTSDRSSTFVSTSRSADIAREFGTNPSSNRTTFVIAQARNGVDVQAASGMLDQVNPYPLQSEVSIGGGIRASDIQGGFRIQGSLDGIQGYCTWHPNPNYVAPTVEVATARHAVAAVAATAAAASQIDARISEPPHE